MEKLDQSRANSIVITAVNYLDCQDIQCSDKLATLWKIRNPWLQQDQHNHIDEIMQDLINARYFKNIPNSLSPYLNCSFLH